MLNKPGVFAKFCPCNPAGRASIISWLWFLAAKNDYDPEAPFRYRRMRGIRRANTIFFLSIKTEALEMEVAASDGVGASAAE